MKPKFDRSKTFWWSPKPKFGLPWLQKENAGDLLGPSIVERLLKERGIDILSQKRGKLFSIGSVMHFAKDGDTIWGTGINGKMSLDLLQFRTLDVRAVRGPQTAEILTKMGLRVPEIFGDPGILTSRYWPDDGTPKKGPAFIPHMREEVPDSISRRYKVISPLISLDEFIANIRSASEVYSSSLHGIIIAESYGIPAALITNKSGEAPFKYLDYYQGTGRNSLVSFDSAEDVRGNFPNPPNIKQIQDRLIETFPFDLWESGRKNS